METRSEGFWWVRWLNGRPAAPWVMEEPAMVVGDRVYSFLGCGRSVSVGMAKVEWLAYLGKGPKDDQRLAHPIVKRCNDCPMHHYSEQTGGYVCVAPGGPGLRDDAPDYQGGRELPEACPLRRGMLLRAEPEGA